MHVTSAVTPTDFPPSDIRLRLIENGYLPIPVNGKRPRIAGWSSIRATPASVAAWERGHADHLNTGVLCGDLVAIDVDVMDPATCKRLTGRLLKISNAESAPCRTGQAPKCLFVFRSSEPREKRKTGEYLVDGRKCQVEVLGIGQQCVAFGTHPDTGRPYSWSGGDLLSIPFSELPEISTEAVDAFLVDAEAILADAGTPVRAPAEMRERATGGETFWQRVNSAALEQPERWVHELFPSAKQEAGTGAWRVTSSALGRALEEDISIHPEGAQDFGHETGTTPIQLVIDYGGAPTPKDAALWLCERLGVDPRALGWSSPAATADGAALASSLLGGRRDLTAANDNKPQPALDIFAWKSSRFVGDPPPVDFFVDGVVPLAVPMLVAAMGDTGKSYLMLETGRRCAFGEGEFASPIFGGSIKRSGTAVFITSEDDQAEVHRRLAALDKRGDRFKLGDKLIVVPLPSAGGAIPFWHERRDRGLEETPQFRKFAEQLAKINDLLFVGIDPLASFAHLAINEDPAAGAFVCASLGRLATETGATVAVAHHMKKTAKAVENLSDARDAIRGSTAIVDGVRLAYALWPAEAERAKKICRDVGKPYAPNAVAFGGVVKANGAAKRILSTYHRNDFGLLVDVSARLGGNAPAQDDLRAALVIAVEAAAEAGRPYKLTGNAGLYANRERLPDELKGLSRHRVEALGREALDRGEIVKAAAKGEKAADWLDVPTGWFARGLGEFRTGAAA
ncbi:MAG: AAA family ATPase [Rhizobiaceae bacterium]|nr:AAA family ATPase [Rhizobiaceae bacterium]MCV0406340.1 AAA family ATPase [Rhizobiaceae bacterium]